MYLHLLTLHMFSVQKKFPEQTKVIDRILGLLLHYIDVLVMDDSDKYNFTIEAHLISEHLK